MATAAHGADAGAVRSPPTCNRPTGATSPGRTSAPISASAWRQALLTGPGDANGDGKVDINDLTIVLSDFGQTGCAWSQGCMAATGKVDINDLTIVLANFGTTYSTGMAAVPEPGMWAFLAVGLPGLIGYVMIRRAGNARAGGRLAAEAQRSTA